MSFKIAERFEAEIEHSMWNKKDFASEVGLSKQALNYSLHFKDDAHWTYGDIVKFCDILNISVGSVIEDAQAKR